MLRNQLICLPTNFSTYLHAVCFIINLAVLAAVALAVFDGHETAGNGCRSALIFETVAGYDDSMQQY